MLASRAAQPPAEQSHAGRAWGALGDVGLRGAQGASVQGRVAMWQPCAVDRRWLWLVGHQRGTDSQLELVRFESGQLQLC